MGTVARLLAEHVSFRCTSVDRIGIRGYIPGLQYEGGVVKFLVKRGNRIPSPAALNRNHERLDRRARRAGGGLGCAGGAFQAGRVERGHRPPLPGRRAAAAGRSGLVLVGKAQERTSSWRGFVDDSHAGHRPGHPHIAWRRQSSVPDHWYLYFADGEWGPAFIKLCSYAPYPLWCCANGHEWAKRQLAKAGIGFEALDNGLRAVDDPAAAHRICARLGAGHVRDLLRRMMAVMPDPLTIEDRRAGFDWSFSIAQLEVSDTAVFDQPRRARAWFEAAIGDHLDLGRPERVSLVVNRRVVNRGRHKTPGRFATEVITRDVAPQLQIHYKSSKAKAYLKEGRALRVETTINNADDFAVHKTLNADNWRALRRVGRRHQRPVPRRARRRTTRPARPRHPRSRSCCPPSTTANALPACASVNPARWPCSAPSPRSPRHRRPHQQVPARPDGRPLAARLHLGAGLLRPAPAPPQRLHRTHRRHQHLPGHRPRPPHRRLLHPTRQPASSSPPSPTSPPSHDHTHRHPSPHHRLANLRTRTHPLLRTTRLAA